MALEKLGHAIEYLVDSRLAMVHDLPDDLTARADTEATQILMRLSRTVFAECAEIVSLRRRLWAWFEGLWVDKPHDLGQPLE